MKKMPILVISSFLLLGVVTGCGEQNPTTSETQEVKSVTINNKSGILTTVYGGSTTSLKATVDGPKGAGVNWSSSNEQVATVTNKGVVRFLNIEKDSTVKIVATSKDDSTKSDEVEFTVKHSPIDLKTSRGIQDASDIETDGITTITGDTALMFNGVYDTKWYVEATFFINELSESDPFPKVGLMSIDNENGFWNEKTELRPEGTKNAYFYLDTNKASAGSGWNGLNFVTQNEELTDWDWDHQTSYFTVDSQSSAQMNGEFTMGLLRDGIDYYLFAKKGESAYCYKHVIYTGISASTSSYALFGGWNVGYTALNFKSFTGEEVDKLYESPTTLTVNASEDYVFLNDTLQLRATTDKILSKITYESANEDIVTVDETGLIYAKATGDATIKVKAGTIEKDILIHVTDNPDTKVELDGNMNDKIYTENVKTNKYRLSKDANKYIDFYTSRNVLGIYIFADYYTDQIKHENEGKGFWEVDNFECRFGCDEDPYIDEAGNFGQFYIGVNGETNFDRRYIGDFVTDETTSLNNVKFEIFVPYASLATLNSNINKDSNIYVSFGYNPANGWIAGKGFGSENKFDHLAITSDGFAYYNGTTLTHCSTQHAYTDWKTINEVSCTADGERTRTCTICNHVDTEVIKKGAHTYDYEHATVVTPSTCTTHGTGTAKCTTCGKTYENVELPLDPNNHNGHDFENGICDCGVLFDPTGTSTTNGAPTYYFRNWGHYDAEKGWCAESLDRWDSNKFQIRLDGSEDFDVEWNFKNYTNGTTNDANFVAEVYSNVSGDINKTFDDNWTNGGLTMRADWWAQNPWYVSHETTYNDGFGAKYKTADYNPEGYTGDLNAILNFLNDSSVRFTVSYKAATGNIEAYAYITHNGTEDTVINTYKANTKGYKGAMVVSLGCNWSKLTNVSVKVKGKLMSSNTL